MEWIFASAASSHHVAISRQGDRFSIRVGRQEYRAKVLRYQAPNLTLLVDDRHVIEGDVEWSKEECRVSLGNIPYHFRLVSPARPARLGSWRQPLYSPAPQIRAPLPGRIIDILVRPGQKVRTGQPVCIIEAMKMQNEICAPSDGIVETVSVQAGTTVEGGTELMRLNKIPPP